MFIELEDASSVSTHHVSVDHIVNLTQHQGEGALYVHLSNGQKLYVKQSADDVRQAIHKLRKLQQSGAQSAGRQP